MKAKNLKYLRKKFEQTQWELGKELGIAQNTLSEYENKTHPIPDDVARKIAYYYRVSLHDFSHVDLSVLLFETKSVFASERGYIPKKVFHAPIMNSLFPMLASSVDCLDSSFVMGYEKMLSLRKRVLESMPVYYEELVDCFRLFKNAWRESRNESALANCICTILFMCMEHNAEKDKKERIFARTILDGNDIGYLEAKEIILRKTFDDTKLSELTQQRLSFVYEYEDCFLEYIRQLKNSSDSSHRDLADFYLACRYFVGFVDNDFDLDTNQEISYQLFMQLYQLENRYARNLLDPLLSSIENVDI